MRRFVGESVLSRVAILLLAATAISIGGCIGEGETSGPKVLEVAGHSVSLGELQREYEARNGAGSFATLSQEEKGQFLETIANKEVLLATARDETGELHAPFDRMAREGVMQWLMTRLEESLTAPLRTDSIGNERMLDQFNKELRLSWFLHPSDSISEIAHQQIVDGRPFAEVARQYSVHDSLAAIGGDLGWKTGESLPVDFVKEIFLDGHGPGYLTPNRQSPRGSEFYQIQDEREFDIRSKTEALPWLTYAIAQVRAQMRLEAFADSLLEAADYELNQEVLPLIMERMSAHWDSLRDSGVDTEQVAREFQPPLFRFSPDEKKMTVCTLHGRDVSLQEYFEGLREVPMTLWPGGDTPETVERQINARMLIGLQFEAARDRGLDKTPAYLANKKITEEKYLLEQLKYERIDPVATPTKEEVAAYYEEHREDYLQGDKIRFSYAVFQKKVEADQFYQKAMTSGGEWWSGQFGRYQQRRPDIMTVPNSPVYDLTQPVPDSVRVLVDLGLDKRVTDVLTPVRYHSGGWVVGRVLYRERPGYLSLERTEVGITRIMASRRTNAMIDSLVTAGRERYQVQLYPENLGS